MWRNVLTSIRRLDIVDYTIIEIGILTVILLSWAVDRALLIQLGG